MDDMMEVYDVVDRMSRGEAVSDDELVLLLTADADGRNAVFSAARSVRDRVFGKKTYLYGFMYFSTHCRNDCSFCYFRKSNNIDRYRKTEDEVVSLAGEIRDAGINLVDLTMGEDPAMMSGSYGPLVSLVARIRDEVSIPIMVSPGALPRDVFPQIAEAGGDIMACYQETYNRRLFAERRLGQDFDFRYNQKVWAMEAGMLAEDGMMVGIGETVGDRVCTIRRMVGSGCDQVRAMTFVPQEGTPMQSDPAIGSESELLCMAVMRLLKHDALIPATLDVEGVDGMASRLDAGANVITSIIPPNNSLAGVAQSCMDIEDGHRSADYVIALLEDELGRKAATADDLRRDFDIRKARLGH